MRGPRSIAIGVVLGATLLSAAPARAAGEVTVSPTTLSFPATFVGDSSTIAVTITNVSGSAITPNYAGGAPIDAANFGGSQNCAGVTLSSGETCAFTYEFTPTTAGPHSSSTTIDVDGENFAISMSGNGLFPISLSRTTLAFPDTPVGQTSTIEVVVRNDSPVNQRPAYAGGAPIDAANFGGSQSCAGVTLPAGGTCAFTYEFTPTTTGPHSSSTTIDVDGENFAISMSGTGTDATTATTTTTATTATTTTTPSATSSQPPNGGPTTTATTSPGALVLVPGPLSDSADGRVIAQGIVDFADGTFGWAHEVHDLGAGPFSFAESSPTFLTDTGAAPLLLRIGDQSSAFLDEGEAVFVPAGSTGDLSSAAPGPGGAALGITFAPSIGPFSFMPGAGRRDVNLVAATLEPGDRLHVVSPFPVLVAVLDGVVHDAPENTEVGAGSARTFNDADLSNSGDVPAVVLVGAVGSAVP